MVDYEKEEVVNLQKEFEWVLHEEIHKGLDQIHQILVECARRFPVALYGHDNSSKQDKFVLTVPVDQLKCVVTLTGDSITHADINFKVTRQTNTTMVRTTIHNENPWKLQQVQDAANHLQQAIYHIDDVGKHYKFKSSDEVLHILGNILGSLQRGRTSLIVPRKKTMDDLQKSRNMKSLSPPLSEDLAISFYIQSHKLIFAIYQLTSNHGVMKYDSAHAECSVPWLNEVLVLFTVGLQLCQQLKDKRNCKRSILSRKGHKDRKQSKLKFGTSGVGVFVGRRITIPYIYTTGGAQSAFFLNIKISRLVLDPAAQWPSNLRILIVGQ